jgi:protein-glutamine gamma-glutamyltransferase
MGRHVQRSGARVVNGLRLLHRRFAALMALTSIGAFLSGAGLGSPSALLAALVLAVATLRQPSARMARRLEPFWRAAALLLIARAAWFIVLVPADVVLPMVDLLLLLLCAEVMRPLESTSDARIYSLSAALFVAASAYRPGVGFALAFVAFLAIGCVALVIGHMARQSARWGVREPPLSRALLLRVAGLSSVMLLSALLVFFTFPRVSGGWMSRPGAAQMSIIGFADQVTLGAHGSRLHPNPAVALRVEFPSGRPAGPLYWRGRSYDHFDGIRWSRGMAIDAAVRLPPAGRVVEQRIYGAQLPVPVVFGLPTVMEIRPESRIATLRDRSGDFIYSGGGAPAYTVQSVVPEPDADALRAARSGTPPQLRPYLQIPVVSERFLLLADSLRRSADNPYDRARAVERFFHDEFEYTVVLPRTPQEAALEHFLFARRAGHCEYFSTAMVLLLRAQGIPSRNVNGFLGGEWNEFGTYLTVTQNQAHSWVEVWFPGHGWITFDPTPSALTEVAAANRSWFFPFRLFGDGLQHRWGKWVLDYDGNRQADLLQRTTGVLAPPPAEGTPAALRVLRMPAVWLASLVFLVLVLLRRRGRREAQVPAPEIRHYLRLREAYARAGVAVGPATPPRAFAAAVRDSGLPGAEPAERAVELYLESRFAGVGEAGTAVDALVSDAVRALRRRR